MPLYRISFLFVATNNDSTNKRFETKLFNFLNLLKNIWNETFMKWTSEVMKIDLHSSRVSHFSLEIFGFVWYVNNSTVYVTLHNDLLGNQVYLWDYPIKSLERLLG